MRYLSLQQVEKIIREFRILYDASITILNKGHLELALEKPKMNIYDTEIYPQLYQKAASLMEALTKLHTLSDGNKRIAMLAAQAFVDINGGRLVLPLKSVRLSIDTAMDADDEMSDIIQQWFKIHTATNECELAAMLTELDEEESIIRGMLVDGREDDIYRLLDQWVGFDNYPDSRQTCANLIQSWKTVRGRIDSSQETANVQWRRVWNEFMTRRDLPHASYYPPQNVTYDPTGISSSLNRDDLHNVEEWIQRECLKCKESTDGLFVLKIASKLERHGMYQDAIHMLERLCDLGDQESHTSHHLARILQYGLKDPESALEYWKICLKHDPDHPLIHKCVADAFVSMGRHIDALEHTKKIPDDYPKINTLRGTIYAGLKEYGKALEYFEKEMSENPGSATAHANLGHVHSDLGNSTRALEYFDKALKIRSDYQIYYMKGIELAQLHKYDESIECYKTALAKNPRHLESRINLASAISNSGNPKQAAPHFFDALYMRPEHPIAPYSLALVLAKMEQYDKALDHIRKMTQLYPLDVDSIRLESMILASLGKIEECLEVLEHLKNTDPDFVEFAKSPDFASHFEHMRHDNRFQALVDSRNGSDGD